jgi:hypothetical protein
MYAKGVVYLICYTTSMLFHTFMPPYQKTYEVGGPILEYLRYREKLFARLAKVMLVDINFYNFFGCN